MSDGATARDDTNTNTTTDTTANAGASIDTSTDADAGGAGRHAPGAEGAAAAAGASDSLAREFLDAAPDGVVITNAAGVILFVNRQTEQILGYRRVDLLGRPVEVLLPERFRDRHLMHRAHYTAAPQTRPMGVGLDLWARRADGQEIPVEISLSPIRGAEGLLLMASLRDVTERAAAEAALRRTADALQRANAELAELERQKDRFFTSVSHDLRTPLAVIKASIGVVLANLPADMPAQLARLLGNIDLAADEMAALVADLLELSRLQAGRVRLRLAEVDLGACVRRAARSIEPLAAARDMRVVVEVEVKVEGEGAGEARGAGAPQPVIVIADAHRLDRVLHNLVGNAQKFGHLGGLIRLRVAPSAEVGAVDITVSDNGPGIPLAEQGRIFERFYRVEGEREADADGATTAGAGPPSIGSGLGLPIARALVELHGGHISVESQPGAGSTFRVTLPVQGPPPAASEAATATDSDTVTVRVTGTDTSAGARLVAGTGATAEGVEP